MSISHAGTPGLFASEHEGISPRAASTATTTEDTRAVEAGPSAPVELSTAELWTLYKHAIDDRNFQVTLNWDRTKHYFVFNTAVLAVAGGLTHLSGAFVPAVGACLLLVALNALFSAYSIWKGHEYYRESRTRMKMIERRIVGSDFAVTTTRGMKRATRGEQHAPFRDRFTITKTTIVLQLYIAVAAGYALVRLVMRHGP